MNVTGKFRWGESFAMVSRGGSGEDIALLGKVGNGQVRVIAFSRVR